MRRVGDMGEAELIVWCSQVGLVPNRSGKDLTGWDSLIEFPLEPSGHVSLDERDNLIECRVQVKSTDSMSRSVKIKLSNLERLVKAPVPAFILFFQFDNQEHPVRAYFCLLYTSPSPRDLSTSRMPSSA